MTDAQRQCLKNITALLFMYDLPIATEPLQVEDDRIWLPATKEFAYRMRDLLKVRHFAPWQYVGNHGDSAVGGWRETVGRCSLQIVLHDTCEFECDIDYFNPDYGVLPALCHAGEALVNWFTKGKTNPFKVAKGLEARGIKV